MKKVKEIFSDGFNNIIENPNILLYFMFVLSGINFVIGIINSVKEMLSIKEYFKSTYNLDNFYSIFSSNIFNKLFAILFIASIIIYLLLMLCNYFINEMDKKTNIFLMITLLLIIFDIFIISMGYLSENNSIAKTIIDFFVPPSLDYNTGVWVILFYLAIPVICILVFLGIMSEKCFESFLAIFIIYILINTLGIPLIIIIIDFIISIIVNIKAIVIGIGQMALGVFVLFILFIGFSGGSSSSYTPTTSYASNDNNSKNSKLEIKKEEPQVKEFKGDVKFVKRYSNNYFSDQIYSITFFGENRVCSASDFDQKKVIIKKDGVEVKFIPRDK